MAKKLIREISPDQMVEAILARRKALASTLPSRLAEREAETNRAYQLVNDAQAKLSALSNEAANDERQKAKHFVEEQETFRRRAVSRRSKASNAMNNNDASLAYWSSLQPEELESLLTDAERVRNGGPSSWGIRQDAEEEEEEA